MKFIPHDYQLFAIEHIKNHKTAAVLLDMGLGRKDRNYINGYFGSKKGN